MTIMEMLAKLSAEVGEDFCWAEIKADNKYFIDEATKEIGHSHPLFGCLMCAVAKCDSNDDVLFAMQDERYTIVHLTYCKNVEPNYPRYALFSCLEDVGEYIKTPL